MPSCWLVACFCLSSASGLLEVFVSSLGVLEFGGGAGFRGFTGVMSGWARLCLTMPSAFLWNDFIVRKVDYSGY